MDMKKYMVESERTTSDKFFLDNDIFRDNTTTMVSEILSLSNACEAADMAKAILFYGSSYEDRLKRVSEVIADTEEKFLSVEGQCEEIEDQRTRDIIHAGLGLMSEAGEVLRSIALTTALGKPIDVKNLREEAGDVMWYLALLLRAIDSSFEKAGEINIEKLKVRFPDKFSKEAAEIRDLEKESEVLN